MIVTISAKSKVNVTVTPDPPVVFEEKIYKGEKGDKGDTGATGATGPAGASAPTYTRRSDFVTDTNYFGSALTGSSESANVWKIYKIVVSSAGTTTKLSATNVAWTNRYIVIYT